MISKTVQSSLSIPKLSRRLACLLLLSTAKLPVGDAFVFRSTKSVGKSLYMTFTGEVMTSSTSKSSSNQKDAAKAVISSFKMTENFDARLRHGHLQSILGFFLRESCSYVPRNESPIQFILRMIKGFESKTEESANAAFWDQRERIDTPDGDWFHVDYKFSKSMGATADSNSKPTVFLVHGLQSSSYGNLAVEMARAFVQQGMNVIALNFRGCSKDEHGNNIPNDTLGAYHLGFTQDLSHFVNIFRAREPNSPIYLSGFSLGANVVLKYLGDLADQAFDWNIRGAAVLCAPLDQTKNAPVLARPFSIQRYVYTDGLLKSLKRMAFEQLDRLQAYDKISIEKIRIAETISDFDDAFIAPIYGFKDCWEYYRETSSIHVLHQIAVPTLILNSKDDPFFDNSVWPVSMSHEYGGPAPLKMVQLDSGGHLGFVFHQVGEDDPRAGTRTPSFGSSTAAAFFDHVQKQPTL